MSHNPKLTCAVFGCKRWTRQFPAGSEFLCGKHYQSVPKKVRHLRSLSQRRYKKFGQLKDLRRADRLWDMAKRYCEMNIGI